MLEFISLSVVLKDIGTGNSVLSFMGLGPMEMMLVGVAAVLLFGRNLPSVARSAGKSLTEFKKGMQDLQNEVKVSIDTDSNVIASNRSAPVMPDSTDESSEAEEWHEDSDYNPDHDDPDHDRSHEADQEANTNGPDQSEENDQLLNEGYPVPRSTSSGMSDDSRM